MKKDVTEANAVSQILQKITLSHPSVSFKFIRDNRMEFNSSGDGELFSAVYAVYGRDFARDLIAVDYTYEGIHIGGYVIKPLYSKTNRAFQNFFVNGRYVRSKLCSAALENSYENMIMTGKFPACVLFIDLPPNDMDVNIHPAKAEVRFVNEKNVSDAVYFAVKNAFMNDGLLYSFELKPKTDWTKPVPQEEIRQQEFIFTPVDKIEETERKMAETPAADHVPQYSAPAAPTMAAPKHVDTKLLADIEEDEREQEISTVENETVEKGGNCAQEEPVSEADPPEAPEPIEGFSYISSRSFESAPEPKKEPEKKLSEWTEKPKIRVIGEAFGLYIVAELGDDTFVMIDKHAAHERIIFERLKSRNCRQYSQTLLTGVKVLLTADEFGALEANSEMLADMGFTFDFSERPCVTATAVPTFLPEEEMENVISEIAENLRLYKHQPQSRILDDMLHTVACKSAIRGNDKNSLAELQSLAEQVYLDERIRHCPHGRPVMFTMSKNNIAHQFGRT